jgi:hypothetical protein
MGRRQDRAAADSIHYYRLVLPEESERLFAKAGEPKKLVMLRRYGHMYAEPAFSEVMSATTAWFGELRADGRLRRRRGE